MEIADAKGKTNFHYVVMGGNAQLHQDLGGSYQGSGSEGDGCCQKDCG